MKQKNKGKKTSVFDEVTQNKAAAFDGKGLWKMYIQA